MTDIIKRLQKVSDKAGVLLTDPPRPTEIKAVCDEAIQIIMDLRAECRRSDNLLEFVINNRPTWQPIETAPRDGTFVLAFTTTRGDAELEEYVSMFEDEPAVVEFVQIGFFDQEWEFEKIGNPTHWMPLPQHPVEKSNNGENQ